MSPIKPLPRIFSLQAHLYGKQQEAAKTLKEAEEEYSHHVAAKVHRIQSVVRSVLAKELGVLSFTLTSEHSAYLPARLRWALRHWKVQPSIRDISLVSHPLPAGKTQRAVVNQDLLPLSDRDIAKEVRKFVREAKPAGAESLLQQAKMLNRESRKENQDRIWRLEAHLEQARKEIKSHR